MQSEEKRVESRGFRAMSFAKVDNQRSREQAEQMNEEISYELGPDSGPNVPSAEFIEVFNAFDEHIDGDILERAWKGYDATLQQVLLEGNRKAWMCCAFYTAVWQATPYGQDPPYLFSLFRLLKTCKLSVLEFFDKLTKWVEMVNGPRRLKDHVSRIQSTLAVSTVIYKKYLRIFRSIFAIKNTSMKNEVISNAKLFEYIWVLLTTLKKLLPAGMEDLMNSYHILLCIVDLISEELRSTSLLNTDFFKQMRESGTTNTLDFLCQQFEGVEIDAKHLLFHWVLPKLKFLHSQRIISGGLESDAALLASWQSNLTGLGAHYERFMMNRLEIDERIFISHVDENMDVVYNESLDDSAITILRRCDLEDSWAVDADLLLRMSVQTCLQKVQFSAKPQTAPHAARSYIISSEQFCPATPITANTMGVQKLFELADTVDAVGEFERLVNQCRDNPRAFIKKRVATLEELIEKKVAEENAAMHDSVFDAEFSSQLPQRLQTVERLFYRLLLKAILFDRQRNPRADYAEMSAILHKNDFVTSVYLCALEIILFTYGSERSFPWSIEVAEMPAIVFYKIIEVIIRAEPELPREVVKHLSHCEERVLEEMAWALDSPLWTALSRRLDGIPSCGAVTNDISTTPTPSASRASYQGTIQNRYAPSPMKPLDRSSVKRRLEFGDDESLPRKKPVDESYGLPSGTSLFFRKLYYLATIRLTDLCDRIRIEESVRNRVWTLFEYLLRAETSLMAGRHLDQNLMCSLYIVAKISNLDHSFHNIMFHYRHQPQASSRVYRRVPIEQSANHQQLSDDGASRDSVGSFSGVGGRKLRSGSAVPAAGQASAPPTPEPHQQIEYVDLIKYYNRVFVPRVEDYVKKMHPANPDSKENIVSVLAMPKLSCTTLSPRKMIGDQIAIVPMSAVTHLPATAGSSQRR